MKTISAVETAKLVLTLSKPEEDYKEYMSKLKLLKLLYYIQGYHLAMFNKPLFNERVQAWLHGPVVKEVYDFSKKLSDEELSKETLTEEELEALNLHPQQLKLIKEVLDLYGKYSAYGLRDKTHQELPWLCVYEKDMNNEITQESLKEFFTPLVEKTERLN